MNALTRSKTSRRGSALRFPLAAVAFAAGAALLVFAGCGLNTHGEGIGGTGGSGGSLPCNIDSQCDDQNPCTKDSCGPDKTCVFVALAEGVDSPTQKAGDCVTVVCKKGEPVNVPDTNDIPDDHKDCTIDSCTVAGKVSHVPKATGTVCDSMGRAGACDAQGNCFVACSTAADCTTTNACITTSCDASKGKCVDANLPDGMPTPGVQPVVGDCKVNICVGGMDTVENDDSDVPVTATDCDTEVCTNGMPSNPPVAFDTPCNTFNGNGKGFCDAASPSPACQACVADGDCPGQAQKNDCQHPACVNLACTIAFTPMGMPAAGTTNPPQVVGDCQRLVCDGNGGTTNIYDSTNPADDGNQCTINTCVSANNTTFPNAPDVSTKCGMGLLLSCLGGQCSGCTMDNQCAPAVCVGTVLTKSQTCNVGAGKCVSVPTQDCAPYLCVAANDACTNKCNNDGDCSQGGVGNYCTGAGGSCLAKLPLGGACPGGNHQCQSGTCADGVCCTSACGGTCHSCLGAKTGGSDGTCAAITSGTDPDNECSDMGALSCGTTGVCGNGACAIYASGTTCVAASCSSGTLTKVRTCNGGGTCTTPMPPTQSCAPYLCNGSACTTSCAGDGDCAASAYCSGVVCTPRLSNGSACSATDQCTSGFCVDGFCCNAACNTACQACSAAKKSAGSDGTCGAAKNGVDPRALCGMSPPCGNDGNCSAGACEKVAAGTLCRASAGTCDVAESCDGMGNCPVDGFKASNTVCRASAGVCDVAENCTGASAACPADGFMSAATVCRAAVDVCDAPESCTGSSAACPADGVLSSATMCRASAGVCDVAENCDGVGTACPADGFKAASTVCRAAVDLCDAVENCTGASAACPADVLKGAGTLCRSANGVCDVAETCDGVSTACPADSFAAMGTVCRVSGGVCDVAESCTGASASCPADGLVSAGTVCRAAVGSCDVAETCDGSAKTCPNDAFVAQGNMSATCTGNNACDGSGGLNADCKLASGQSCAADGDCANGTCLMPQGHCN